MRKDPQGSGASVVIWPMISAFGWNDDFIIAQRHPVREGVDDVDTTVTEWYILVVSDRVVHGPLTETEFRQLRQDLGVPTCLEFSRTIEPEY